MTDQERRIIEASIVRSPEVEALRRRQPSAWEEMAIAGQQAITNEFVPPSAAVLRQIAAARASAAEREARHAARAREAMAEDAARDAASRDRRAVEELGQPREGSWERMARQAQLEQSRIVVGEHRVYNGSPRRGRI